ncbi:MAG: hypothetical protein H0V51_12340 [Chloroflexi bacterium]|nr:hypothetical protein [Chloroflexota bacterium]
MTTLSMVTTVTGPIRPDQLGITLTHEHLLIELHRITRVTDGHLDNIELAVRELGLFKDAGGQSLVDATNEWLGRNPLALRQIAQSSGVNVIMGSGWYREPYYPPELNRRTTNDLADEIIRDHQVGVGDTGVRSGIIGEIGCDWDYISGIEERVFRAAARAHKQTGLTITTHASRSPVGLTQLDLLAEEGVDPRRVIVGHCDTYPHPWYHEAVASRGAWVQFDRNHGKYAWEVEIRIGWIKNLVDKGYIRQLLLASDNCNKSDLQAYGGTGYAFILTGLVPRLLDAGLSREHIDQIMVDNPRRALTGAE